MYDLSRPRHSDVGTDEEIGVDDAKLAAAPEPDLAAVDARADDEVVVVSEHLVVAECLQRGACRQPLGKSTVDRAPGRLRTGIAATGRTIDRLAVLIEDLEGGRRRSRLRKGIVFQAQCVEQRIGGSPTAALDLGGIGVDMLLIESAII